MLRGSALLLRAESRPLLSSCTVTATTTAAVREASTQASTPAPTSPRARSVQRLKIRKRMRSSRPQRTRTHTDRHVCALLHANSLDSALAVALDNENDSLRPQTYTLLLKAAAAAGDVDGIRALHKRIRKSDVMSVDRQALNSLVWAYAREGLDEDAANVIQHDMPRFYVHPDAATLNGLMACFAQRGDIDKANELVSVMEADRGTTPDEHTTSVLVSTYINAGMLDQACEIALSGDSSVAVRRVAAAAAADGRSDLVDTLTSKGLSERDSTIYTALATASAPDATAATLHSALNSVLHAGKHASGSSSRDLVPVFEAVAKGLASASGVSDVVAVTRKMIGCGLPPTHAVIGAVVAAESRDLGEGGVAGEALRQCLGGGGRSSPQRAFGALVTAAAEYARGGVKLATNDDDSEDDEGVSEEGGVEATVDPARLFPLRVLASELTPFVANTTNVTALAAAFARTGCHGSAARVLSNVIAGDYGGHVVITSKAVEHVLRPVVESGAVSEEVAALYGRVVGERGARVLSESEFGVVVSYARHPPVGDVDAKDK